MRLHDDATSNSSLRISGDGKHAANYEKRQENGAGVGPLAE